MSGGRQAVLAGQMGDRQKRLWQEGWVEAGRRLEQEARRRLERTQEAGKREEGRRQEAGKRVEGRGEKEGGDRRLEAGARIRCIKTCSCGRVRRVTVAVTRRSPNCMSLQSKV